MEDNEKNEVLDTQEESNEELEETEESNEVEETTDEPESNNDSSSPTLEDYEALKKKAETLQAQKEHWRKKAEKPALKKTNETPQGLTREEAILYAKGYTDEEVNLANKLSTINGVSILKATEDELFKAKVENRKKEERSKKAQLAPSGSGSIIKSEKPQGEMTRQEHEAYYKKVMGV